MRGLVLRNTLEWIPVNVRRASLFSKCGMLVAFIPLFACISACYPHPHQYIRTQEFSGVLLKSGLPVSAAAVYVSHAPGDNHQFCEGAKEVAVTSSDGHFHIDRVVEEHLFTSVLNPPDTVLQTTSICFHTSEANVLGVTTLSHTDRKLAFVLSCDLDSPPVDFKQGVILQPNEWGICKNGGKQ